MNTSKAKTLSSARAHIASQVSKVHKKYKGQHKFLNALFFSPGDEYYGVFDKSHTYDAVSEFQQCLQTMGMNILFTDVKFDADLNLIYCFEIESADGSLLETIEHKTNRIIPETSGLIDLSD